MQDSLLEFEPIELKHLDAIMLIEPEAYPEPWTEAMFRDEIRGNRSYFYVVNLGPELIGYGGFWLVVDEAHITSVTIRNDLRGRGYGRCLLAYLLEVAVKVGAEVATLEVRTSNAVARELYASMGFRVAGLRKKYYPKSNEDAIIMTKELA
ncbi:MAG: hypothetical protein AMXMBFR84_35820 [Candidatus Hydrogenedentota bacterium]